MMRGDDTNAVLWDIRVDPKAQHRGIGTLLFETAMAFGRQEGCHRMLIETQNNNPRAIRFYEAQGATLLEINRNHYPDQPAEDQLIFTTPLSIKQQAGRS
jgi:ribosomal protein S18 acetylase RimI-like enzyme